MDGIEFMQTEVDVVVSRMVKDSIELRFLMSVPFGLVFKRLPTAMRELGKNRSQVESKVKAVHAAIEQGKVSDRQKDTIIDMMGYEMMALREKEEPYDRDVFFAKMARFGNFAIVANRLAQYAEGDESKNLPFKQHKWVRVRYNEDGEVIEARVPQGIIMQRG